MAAECTDHRAVHSRPGDKPVLGSSPGAGRSLLLRNEAEQHAVSAQQGGCILCTRHDGRSSAVHTSNYVQEANLGKQAPEALQQRRCVAALSSILAGRGLRRKAHARRAFQKGALYLNLRAESKPRSKVAHALMTHSDICLTVGGSPQLPAAHSARKHSSFTASPVQ